MIVPGCTIAAIWENGRYMLGSNSDNPWNTRTRVRFVEGNRWRFMGTELVCPDESLPWSNMVTRGINEKGIAFTFSYVDCSPKFYQGGIEFKDFGYHILGNFHSLKDIESYLRHEPVRVHGNFLFADSLGNLLISEIHPAKKHFEWNPNTPIIRTNHFMNLPFFNAEEITITCSILRYQSGMNVLNQETSKQGSEFLKFLLCNHHLKEQGAQWGGSTCNHGEEVGTVSSELLDPLNQEILYCFGPPCGEAKDLNGWGKYIPFKLYNWTEGVKTTVEGKIL
ncbi:carcinine hydrolase/isopenicillin-N N-acyltransferase family protein [Ammoniphilus sp. YIM 78166]|uniref:carcinine hydrolase/isopenicillin-N N-acyltransferase family protein n=1 Tax=Ammoniphilus sp. YIM 78166 TaxID=1644106 RepID=UPI0010705BA4|nr:carcinine hydrolase/isopenicillin-N N-acyltransferase family protein [Ammoniphilus sp. YIM 78166]